MARIAALLAALLLWTPQARADTLIDNINGYTLSAQGTLLRFSALLIGNDGRVRQLLTARDKKPERPDYRLDGRGRTVIPGFVDAHAQLMRLGYRSQQLDLSTASSLDEALARIKAHAAVHPTPRWIRGFGWDEERWSLGRLPTAADLDEAVADRPIWIERIDGHSGWANSAAMKEAGLNAASVAPPGGRIEKAGKLPSGVLSETAMRLVAEAAPKPLPVMQDRAFLNAQDRLLAAGITSIADMGTRVEDWHVLRRAGDRGALLLRISAYADGVDTALAIAGTQPTPWLYDGRLRMIGVSLAADGALGPRGAWLNSPYNDASGSRGLPAHSEAELKNLMSRAAMDGFQLAVRAAGDAANARLLDAIEELAATYRGDRRWRIEGAHVVAASDLDRLGRIGAVASMQPAAAMADRKIAVARLGSERLGGAWRWDAMLANRIPLAFGSGAARLVDPFPAIAAVMTREDAAARKLTLVDAFAAFTTGAAFAAFDEKRIGTLEPGRKADFLFIDRDVFANADNPSPVGDARVLETWIGGRKVWERK